MKVIISTGFTGGHLFPAVACGDYIKSIDPSAKITYIASERIKSKSGLYNAVKNATVVYLEDAGFSLMNLPRVVAVHVRNLIKSWTLLQTERPDAVVGFGSNLSFAPVILAAVMGIPTVIHEQNGCYGKANRMLAPFVRGIALSFAGTSHSPKAVVTGNLIRSAIVESARTVQAKKAVASELLSILVLGGSQGASFLNGLLVDMLDTLTDEERARLHVAVITGTQDYEMMQTVIPDRVKSFEVVAFTDEMAQLYRKADLVIARAGGGVVAEALAFCLPAIYVPYPFAGSHQIDNARPVARGRAGWIVEQNGLSVDAVVGYVRAFLRDRSVLERASQAACKMRVLDSAERLYSLLMATITERH